MTSPTTPAGRYGASANPNRSVFAIAAALALVFFGWVAWVMTTDPTAGVEWVAFESTSGANSASVKFQISAPPGTPVSCALRTVDKSMGTSGWRVTRYAASTQHTTQYEETVRSVRSTSGIEVYRCWRSGS